MSGGEEQNKSEEATPFKLTKAREKGNVARGTDLGFFSSLAAFLLFLAVAGVASATKLMALMRSNLSDFSGLSDPATATRFIGQDVSVVLSILVLVGLTVLVIVVPLEIFQLRGLVFSSQPLKPDFTKLNPAQGFKRLFSRRTLQEAIKTVFKFLIYALIAVLAIRYVVSNTGLASTDARQFAALLWQASIRLLLFFAGAALAFAIFDQIIARREFSRQMRMSRSEVTREYKEREGEPRIKAKRKQLHAEFLQQTEGIGKLAGSDLLIVNPEHFAVALAYDPVKMSAPTVRAKARNQLALALRREALRLNIPIVPDPPLARSLFKATRAGNEIGADQFSDVAKHYSALRAAQAKRENP